MGICDIHWPDSGGACTRGSYLTCNICWVCTGGSAAEATLISSEQGWCHSWVLRYEVLLRGFWQLGVHGSGSQSPGRIQKAEPPILESNIIVW